MQEMLLYPIGCTAACGYALQNLSRMGIPITDHPCPEVTHLLLDVPSFREPGKLRCGMEAQAVLETLPIRLTVIGGMLDDPALSGYRKTDLLKDSLYLAKNAVITAQCAMTLAASRLNTTLPQTEILIIGWGRIGKTLARLLKNMGTEPVVLAHKEADRAMLAALGYRTLSSATLKEALPTFRLILNTAPETVLDEELSGLCRKCVKIDLASKPGILGDDVIRARGLPGQCVPESSGMLIADTVVRLLKEESK